MSAKITKVQEFPKPLWLALAAVVPTTTTFVTIQPAAIFNKKGQFFCSNQRGCIVTYFFKNKLFPWGKTNFSRL